LVLAFPLALLAGFGHFAPGFQICGHLLAVVPGLVGDFLRIAYYFLTLEKCSLDSRISFGSFFAQSDCIVGPKVYIGSYCVLGSCNIGERTQIATQVQVLSGRHQHSRDSMGKILGARKEDFQVVSIGADCWIGASAIVMADIGAGTTVGAAAVVNRPLPEKTTAVGNPARIL
jgi:virginiamycin A acetyltransferase